MKIAVAGAGLTGLVAALRLARAGHELDVYELMPWAGGQVAALDLGAGTVLERVPVHWRPEDRAVLGLCAELGLDEVTWAPSPSAVIVDGAVRPWSTTAQVLRLPLGGRLDRLALRRAQRALEQPAPDGAEQPVGAWATGRIARPGGGLDALWEPMLRRRLGARGPEVPVGSIREHLGGLPLLGRLTGSHAVLIAALIRALSEAGGRLWLDRPMARVGPGEQRRLRVTPAAPGSHARGADPREYDPFGSPQDYDAVLCTVAPHVFADLLEEPLFATVGEARLDALEAAAGGELVSLLLELDRRATPAERTVVADETFTFTELVSLEDPAAAGDGRHFLYVTRALAADEAPPAADADPLLAAHLPSLRRAIEGFSPGRVLDAHLSRVPGAVRAVPAGTRLPGVGDTGVAGLLVATGAQGPGAAGGPDAAVRLGELAAAALSG